MPWETGSVVSASQSTKRNVGVLEVKMRHRLQEDPRAVAIGALKRADGSNKKPRHHGGAAAKRVHKLPQLAAPLAGADRPQSFEHERDHAMDAVALPSPTRSLIHKHVEHAKHAHDEQLAHLPPVAGAFKKRTGGAGSGSTHAPSLFPQAYQRGELPIMVESKAGGQTVRWTQDIKQLDYAKMLPLFLDGMRESAFPFHFLAREGAFQLLRLGREYPERVLDCLPRVVPAVRAILDRREPKFLRDALLILRELAQTPGVGQALVPYYRQLLPVLNMFKSKRRNLGDAIDFQQHKLQDVSEMIVETLEQLEATGGPDAYVNIKYMVPTYEGARKI